MIITYFYRHPESGFSIGRVFATVRSAIAKSCEVREVYMPFKWLSARAVLGNLRAALRAQTVDSVNHITGEVHYLSLALDRNRTITTVHDLARLDNNHDPRQLHGLKKWLYLLLYVYPLRRNRYVVCISEQTKRTVQKYVNIPDDKLVVIPDPVSDDYDYSPKMFNASKPVILFVGTGRNKNLELSIDALSGLSISLRIIGRLSAHQSELLDKSGIHYSNESDLTDQQMVSEYKNCDMVLFPSLYEGFGMPVIEAQQSGRPVVTSNISPIKEVAGNGALLIDPNDKESIREGVLSVINDMSLRNEIISAGLQNCKRFGKSVVARQYLEIYQQL